MITLELIPSSSAPTPPPVDKPFAGTTLNVQPATASAAAPTAPPQFFPRVGKPTIDMEAVRAGMQIPVETTFLDLSVARSLAGANAAVLALQGTAFFIDKGTDVGLATLHIQDQTNTPVNSINVFPGDAYDVPFTFIVVENTAQPGKVLRIHYGTNVSFKPGLGGNITFTGGVAILQTAAGAPQGADQATSSNNAFASIAGNIAVAGQLSFAGISNPNASGKRVYIDAITVLGGAAAAVYQVVFGAVALGTDRGAWTSKKSAGVSANSHVFTGAAILGVNGSQSPDTFQPPVNGSERHVYSPPLIVEANNGGYVQCNTANTAINTAIEGREF